MIEVQTRQLCSGKVCGDSIDGFDCGDNVSNWLEDVLGLTGKINFFSEDKWLLKWSSKNPNIFAS